jgi:putative multiple sugar transport system permease protein
MSTETAGPVVSSAKSSMQDAMKANLREYGLIVALIAIMLFFQYMTKGVLFYPVNLTNIVLQNSYIVVMALGMLLVIVAGHIDLSVGSVAGFIGGLAAILMVDYGLNPLLAGLLCIAAGAAVGGVQGYFVAYMKIPSFIVTLAGMLVFKGPLTPLARLSPTRA